VQNALVEALNAGDFSRTEFELKTLFSWIPYQLHIEAEAYYHALFFLLLKFYGMNIYSEVSMAKGRIDVVIEIEPNQSYIHGAVYVMECKYENCSSKATDEEKQNALKRAVKRAFEQIEENGYVQPYLDGKREVYQVGIAVTARDEVLVVSRLVS
jgi:hypothetical protein